MTTADHQPYILGADDAELARLRFQHKVWTPHLYALAQRAGLRAGQTAIDLGSGPGYTTLELAAMVGERGRVLAVDESPYFIEHVKRHAEQFALANIETQLTKAEHLEAEPESFDLAYARWLFCWMEDPVPALQRAADALRPGAALAMHEYLHWGSIDLYPESDPVRRALEACRASWDHGKADMNFAQRLPDLAPTVGLTLEHFDAIPRMGRVGSMEWQWVGTFLRDYLPRLGKLGLYDMDDFPALQDEWRRLEIEGRAHVLTPLMSEAILRKPA